MRLWKLGVGGVGGSLSASALGQLVRSFRVMAGSRRTRSSAAPWGPEAVARGLVLAAQVQEGHFSLAAGPARS